MVRADAQRNRAHILDIAKPLLASDAAVSLNAVAKAAGVGAGTLYRHFPTREALVLAVYEDEIARLVALAPALLGDHPPLEAFRLWLDRLAHYGRIKGALNDMIHALMTPAVHNATYGPMVDAIAQLLRAGHATGELRDGVDPEDVLILLGFLWRLPPGPAGEARAHRMIGLALDALRPRQG